MYDSSEIAARIKDAAKKQGKSVRTVLSDCELGVNTITKLSNGTDVQSKNLAKIADYLGVSVDYLLGRSDTPTHRRKGVKIPVLGRVQAGMPVEAVEEILDYEEITEEMAATGEFFGLRVRGDSMLPTLVPDDIVIVRKQPDARDNDIVVALVGNEDATIKKLKHTPNGVSLIPINEAYPILYYDNQQIIDLPVCMIGKVVELRRSF